MDSQVLILGGQGRIGQQVAADITAHTTAQVTVTGRQRRVSQRSGASLLPELPLQLSELSLRHLYSTNIPLFTMTSVLPL